jgi:hypothetical protein
MADLLAASLSPRQLSSGLPSWVGPEPKPDPSPRDSPHPCGAYGVARPAEMLVSMALSRPSLIRMRPLVQVQPGPLHRLELPKCSLSVSSIEAGPGESPGIAVLECIPALLPSNDFGQRIGGSQSKCYGGVCRAVGGSDAGNPSVACCKAEAEDLVLGRSWSAAAGVSLGLLGMSG